MSIEASEIKILRTILETLPDMKGTVKDIMDFINHPGNWKRARECAREITEERKRFNQAITDAREQFKKQIEEERRKIEEERKTYQAAGRKEEEICLLTGEEVAEMLHRTSATIRRWARKGIIKPARLPNSDRRAGYFLEEVRNVADRLQVNGVA